MHILLKVYDLSISDEYFHFERVCVKIEFFAHIIEFCHRVFADYIPPTLTLKIHAFPSATNLLSLPRKPFKNFCTSD